jgi:hypothetical protein
LPVGARAMVRSAMIGVVHVSGVLLMTGIRTVIVGPASRIVLCERAGRNARGCAEREDNELLCFHRT